ncbi:hypothetical protein NDU88_000217 [Pleurodeles waltl]|uniref:Uncharacterized protein n=1 Tax=Pleurodeles waltl TaxID=8319 RepID=A0AAV7VVE8_PLEWA|nr:hypothetical protein NDU88_000217 [Pleurodeles waltl]
MLHNKLTPCRISTTHWSSPFLPSALVPAREERPFPLLVSFGAELAGHFLLWGPTKAQLRRAASQVAAGPFTPRADRPAESRRGRGNSAATSTTRRGSHSYPLGVVRPPQALKGRGHMSLLQLWSPPAPYACRHRLPLGRSAMPSLNGLNAHRRPRCRSARLRPLSAAPANRKRSPEMLPPDSPSWATGTLVRLLLSAPESSWRPSTLGGALAGGGQGPLNRCGGLGGGAR